MVQQSQQQAVAAVEEEQVGPLTGHQVSAQIQQQHDPQAHWERTVRATPETVVVEEPEVEEPMAVQAETVDLMTLEAQVVEQDQT
jgi:hypothetical protein